MSSLRTTTCDALIVPCDTPVNKRLEVYCSLWLGRTFVCPLTLLQVGGENYIYISFAFGLKLQICNKMCKTQFSRSLINTSPSYVSFYLCQSVGRGIISHIQ